MKSLNWSTMATHVLFPEEMLKSCSEAWVCGDFTIVRWSDGRVRLIVEAGANVDGAPLFASMAFKNVSDALDHAYDVRGEYFWIGDKVSEGCVKDEMEFIVSKSRHNTRALIWSGPSLVKASIDIEKVIADIREELKGGVDFDL